MLFITNRLSPPGGSDSFDRPQEDQKLNPSWSHPVVLYPGLLDLESCALIPKYYFGICSPELNLLVPLSYSRRRPRRNRYSDRLYNFSAFIGRCYE